MLMEILSAIPIVVITKYNECLPIRTLWTSNPRARNEYSGIEKKCKSSQKLTKRQQPVATSATTSSVTFSTVPTTVPVTPILAKQYAGNLPKWKKCKYHHHGVFRELHYNKCNMKRHITRFCRISIWHITSTTNVRASPICHLCGELGHFKRDYPTERNDGGAGWVWPQNMGKHQRTLL